jgi:hypothetical protein
MTSGIPKPPRNWVRNDAELRNSYADFAQFIEVYAFFDYREASVAGYWRPRTGTDASAMDDGGRLVDVPSLVLRDTNGDELWLGGDFTWGCGGPSARKSVQFLKEIGFSTDLVEFVKDYRVVHLKSDSKNPIVAKDSIYWGRHDEFSSVMNTGSLRFGLDGLRMLDVNPGNTNDFPDSIALKCEIYAKEWVDAPRRATAYKDHTAGRGACRTWGDQTYTLTLQGGSGRELWLDIPTTTGGDMFSEKLLQVCRIFKLRLPRNSFPAWSVDLSS